MVIEELVLHNFGLYLGRQVLALDPPSRTRPIVLIGGLNGAGKTTLLDALQLVLYGPRARCSNRGTLGYEDYLRRSIHRSVPPGEGAALEIRFSETREGATRRYRVRRTWSATPSRVKHAVDVHVDGHPDGLLTEGWDEAVEDILPVGLSQLFFFDGEKIEGLADTESSARVLGTAVHTLLGLDLVESLNTDLTVLERRKRKKSLSEADQRRIEEAEGEIKRLAEQRRELFEAAAAGRSVVDQRKRAQAAVEERFRREGGEAVGRRGVMEVEIEGARTALAAAEQRLVELAGSTLPLAQVGELLAAVASQADREERAGHAMLVASTLEERDRATVDLVAYGNAPPKIVMALTAHLEADRAARENDARSDRYLDLSSTTVGGIRALRSLVLPQVLAQAQEGVAEAERLRARVEAVERQLAAIPDADAIAKIAAELQAARVAREEADLRLAEAEAQLRFAQSEFLHAEGRLTKLLAEGLQTQEGATDDARLLAQLPRVREILHTFRGAVVQHQIHKIEQLVLESYRALLRKQALVEGIRINPEQFSVELRGAGDQILAPERLSAGERQLLAVSLLWGLARASGRPLPVVIDTPLGRLDADHRSKLVERYFPHASHQVLLLSTDKEIDAATYETLRSRVGRAYHLAFQDGRDATEVRDGYFPEA